MGRLAAAEILINDGRSGPPVSAAIGVYELDAGRLAPDSFPSGSNQFPLANSWTGYAGAFCRSPGLFATWIGNTNGGGNLTHVTSRTYRMDTATLTFTLVGQHGPLRTSKHPATGWDELCGGSTTNFG